MLIRIVLWAIVVVVALVAVVVVVGYLLPKEHTATRSGVLHAGRLEVFSALVNVARYPEWRGDVSKVEILSSAPLRWKEHGSNGTITFEVREARAPEHLVAAIADPDLPFGGTWTYDLEAVDGGTRLTITENGEVRNPVFRFMSRFVFSQTATMEKYLAALERRLQSPAGA